jgi:hypothetical protein
MFLLRRGALVFHPHRGRSIGSRSTQARTRLSSVWFNRVEPLSEVVTARQRSYIRNQEHHHRKRSFEEEYMDFLNKHGFQFDPNNLFG